MDAGKLLAFVVLFVSCAGENDTVEESQVQELARTGAEYLRRVMSHLQNDRSEGHSIELSELTESEASSETVRDHANYVTPVPQIPGPTRAPALQAEVISSPVIPVPEIPPGLTAQELTAIYNAAITKVADMPDIHSPIQAVSSTYRHPPPARDTVVTPAAHGPAGDALPGYYYYYYPIKTFLKAYTETTRTAPAAATVATTPKPVVMHATVHMTDSSNKGVEPLFMAISGFIGMALMFAFSVLFVPKFGKLRSGEANDRNDLFALGRVVFDSMEGKDCGERLACELGRVLRRVKMDDKPLRVLEIVLPPKLGKQVTMVRKAAAKRGNCEGIPCKIKKPQKNSKVKPWRKTQTPHDLWMKHFEKKTKFTQPENIWDRAPATKPRWENGEEYIVHRSEFPRLQVAE